MNTDNDLYSNIAWLLGENLKCYGITSNHVEVTTIGQEIKVTCKVEGVDMRTIKTVVKGYTKAALKQGEVTDIAISLYNALGEQVAY